MSTLAAIVLFSFLGGCGPSQEEARNQLREAGFYYEKSGFFNAAEGAGKPKSVKLFLQAGMSSDVKNDLGKSPLHVAAGNGQTKRVKILLEHGATLNPEKSEPSPLAEAAKYGHVEAVEVLLENGADPNPGNRVETAHGGMMEVRSPLSFALDPFEGFVQAELATLLIENGANPNERDGGEPLLFDAVWRGEPEIVKAMLNAGAEVDVRDEDGRTPLIDAATAAVMESVEDGEVRIIEVLLDHGANPAAKSDDGRTALGIAKAEGKAEVVEVLQNAS